MGELLELSVPPLFMLGQLMVLPSMVLKMMLLLVLLLLQLLPLSCRLWTLSMLSRLNKLLKTLSISFSNFIYFSVIKMPQSFARTLELLHRHCHHLQLLSVLEVALQNLHSAQGMHWINTRLLHRRLQLIVSFFDICVIYLLLIDLCCLLYGFFFLFDLILSPPWAHVEHFSFLFTSITSCIGIYMKF